MSLSFLVTSLSSLAMSFSSFSSLFGVTLSFSAMVSSFSAMSSSFSVILSPFLSLFCSLMVLFDPLFWSSLKFKGSSGDALFFETSLLPDSFVFSDSFFECSITSPFLLESQPLTLFRDVLPFSVIPSSFSPSLSAILSSFSVMSSSSWVILSPWLSTSVFSLDLSFFSLLSAMSLKGSSEFVFDLLTSTLFSSFSVLFLASLLSTFSALIVWLSILWATFSSWPSWTMFSLSIDLPISVLMLSPRPNDEGVINLTFSFFISTGCGILAGFSPKSTSQSRSGKMDSPWSLEMLFGSVSAAIESGRGNISLDIVCWTENCCFSLTCPSLKVFLKTEKLLTVLRHRRQISAG